MMSSIISFGRSVLALPSGSDTPREVAASIQGLSIIDPGNSRSRARPPPRAEALQRSTISKRQTLSCPRMQYDEVVLWHYLSTQLPKNKISLNGPLDLRLFPVTGKGRVFTVRRFPTGWGQEMEWGNFQAPAAAVKSLSPVPVDASEEEKSFQYRSLIQELRILLHGPLSEHINFVKIQGLGWEPDLYRPESFLPNVSIEFAKFGTLGTFLGNFESTYVWKQRIILDVAEALAALHACGIAHSDVKLDNVLMFPCDDQKFPIVAKLSDFGFSLDLVEGSGLVGLTPLWAAPEVLHGKQDIDFARADVYSLGFLIWATVAAGTTLFEASWFPDSDSSVDSWTSWKDSNELVSRAVAQTYSTEQLPADTDLDEVCLLIDATLQKNPSERQLDLVLNRLRGQCDREREQERGAVPLTPIRPFDLNKVS